MKIKRSLLVRHGDVFLRCNNATLKQTRDEGGRVKVRLGESTGHNHSIGSVAEFSGAEGTYSYIKTNGISVLTHNTHKPIQMPAAEWEILDEKDYDPFDKILRKALD